MFGWKILFKQNNIGSFMSVYPLSTFSIVIIVNYMETSVFVLYHDIITMIIIRTAYTRSFFHWNCSSPVVSGDHFVLFSHPAGVGSNIHYTLLLLVHYHQSNEHNTHVVRQCFNNTNGCKTKRASVFNMRKND